MFRIAIYADIPSMRQHQGSGDGEAHASSLAQLCAFLAAIKLFENMRSIDFVNTGAAVLHFKLEPAFNAAATKS